MVLGDIAYQNQSEIPGTAEEAFVYSVPSYSGSPYTEVNHNKPFFGKEEMTTEVFEHYSELDILGRCGVAYASICQELMPTEERGQIGMDLL